MADEPDDPDTDLDEPEDEEEDFNDDDFQIVPKVHFVLPEWP